MKVRVIVNRSGGTLGPDGPEQLERIGAAFAKNGVEADPRLCEPAGLPAAFAEAAAAPGLDAVVAGGGDGTVSCAAAALADSGRPLGVIPLGTLNHLARDAGIPADLDDAVAVIAAGRTRAIDVGEVNGHSFVNNSAVGLYPEMVRFRDEAQAQGGRGRRSAMLIASLRALRSFRPKRLWIKTAGLEGPVRTPLLLVGNNRYQVNLLALGRRDALDRGELCLYAVRARSRAHLLWAGLRGLLGRLDQQRDFLTACVEELEIGADRPALTLSLDGETLTMATPLRYRIRPKALALIVPGESGGTLKP